MPQNRYFRLLQVISFDFPLIFLVSAQQAPGASVSPAEEVKGKPNAINCKIENIDVVAFRSLGNCLYCNPNMFIH